MLVRRTAGALVCSVVLSACGATEMRPASAPQLPEVSARGTESGKDDSAERVLILFGPTAAENVRTLDLRVQVTTGEGSDVVLTWAYPGSPTSRAIVGSGPPGAVRGRQPLWLSVPLRRRSGPAVTVVAAPRQLSAWSAAADRAWARARRWLDQPPTPVVVEVAPNHDLLAAALAAQPGEFAGSAAVSTTPDGSAADSAPVHVFVDAGQVDPDTVAAEILIAHELVHAVTRSPLRSRAPIWWREGYAEYVAFADGGLPPGLRDGPLRAPPQGQSPQPGTLPTESDFTRDPAWSYPASRLAVETLVATAWPGATRAERAKALRRIDVRLGSDDPPAAVLREEAGISPRRLERMWLRRLRDFTS